MNKMTSSTRKRRSLFSINENVWALGSRDMPLKGKIVELGLQQALVEIDGKDWHIDYDKMFHRDKNETN